MEHKIIDISELTDRQLEMAIAYHCENFTVEEVPNDVNGENGGFILANKALLKKGYTYPPKGKLSPSFMTPRYMNDFYSLFSSAVTRFKIIKFKKENNGTILTAAFDDHHVYDLNCKTEIRALAELKLLTGTNFNRKIEIPSFCLQCD